MFPQQGSLGFYIGLGIAIVKNGNRVSYIMLPCREGFCTCSLYISMAPKFPWTGVRRGIDMYRESPSNRPQIHKMLVESP